jgi:hypothetical protein
MNTVHTHLIPPDTPDWRWLGARTVEQIAELAAHRNNPKWVKQAYSWLFHRCGTRQQDKLPRPQDAPVGPPVSLVPVLAASTNRGMMGFVSVTLEECRRIIEPTDTEMSAYRAADWIADEFRQLNQNLGWPRITFHLPDGGGTSVALSTMIATLAHVLNASVCSRLAATGQVDTSSGRLLLKSVSPDTIGRKIEIAEQWGYTKLLVIEGQQGIGNANIDVFHIPETPELAVFAILRHALAEVPDRSIAEFLAVMDKQLVRVSTNDTEFRRALDVTEQFSDENNGRLVRFFLHDIRSRIWLHQGHTGNAAEERDRAGRDRPEIFEFPDGWLGEYLKWHRAAHESVVAIDEGRWDEEESEHQLLHRTVQRLFDAIEDHQAGRPELLAALFLGNTRARRRLYASRWNQDSDSLRLAWDDAVRLQQYWTPLFAYCHEIGLRDSDLRRQQNLCIDVLSDFHQLHGTLPIDWDYECLKLWPAQPDCSIEELETSFDLAYYLRWQAIAFEQVDERKLEQILNVSCQLAAQYSLAYPSYLPFEVVLRYHLGNTEQRQLAAQQLSKSQLFYPNLDSRSILTLLAIRAVQLVERAGVSTASPISPAEGTRLAERTRDLLSRPEAIVARCPY